MLLIHKLFKKHSLHSLTSKLLVVATACVFLVCKVRYMPICLETAATAMFIVEKKLLTGGSYVAAARFPGEMISLMATHGPRRGMIAAPDFTEQRKHFYMS